MKITISTFTLLIAAALAALPAMQRGVLAESSEQADSERITKAELDHESFCAIGCKPGCNIELAVARGLFPTGLHPRFAPGVKCRGIDETYAMDYTSKRDRESYHGSIDMPAPFGTPIRAAAAGTVVGVYNSKGHRGIQLILRHTHDLWTFAEDAAFLRRRAAGDSFCRLLQRQPLNMLRSAASSSQRMDIGWIRSRYSVQRRRSSPARCGLFPQAPNISPFPICWRMEACIPKTASSSGYMLAAGESKTI